MKTHTRGEHWRLDTAALNALPPDERNRTLSDLAQNVMSAARPRRNEVIQRHLEAQNGDVKATSVRLGTTLAAVRDAAQETRTGNPDELLLPYLAIDWDGLNSFRNDPARLLRELSATAREISDQVAAYRREWIVSLTEEGRTIAEVARMVGLNRASVQKVLDKHKRFELRHREQEETMRRHRERYGR